MRALVLAAAASIALAGCTTLRETNPQRTATEQLLIANAADRAAKRMTLDVPAGTRVFVDARYFDSPDAKYAIGSIRDRFLRQGLRLVDEKRDAEVVAEIRLGALSIDNRKTLVGLPGGRIPVPLASESLTIPDIALYKMEERVGIARFAVTGRNTENGGLAAASGPVHGYSHRTRWVLALFFSWTSDDLVPEGQEDGRGPHIPYTHIPRPAVGGY